MNDRGSRQHLNPGVLLLGHIRDAISPPARASSTTRHNAIALQAASSGLMQCVSGRVALL